MSVRTRTRRIKRNVKRPTRTTARTRVRMTAVRKEKSIPWRESFKNTLKKHSVSGSVLRGSRYKNEISQRELAKALGISQHHISEMENGKRPIGKEMAKRFADFFKTDYRIFL